MLLARNAGLSFVPRIFEFNNQKTVIRHDNANWDIAEWMPGKADFHSNSKIERLIDACEALKQLHYSWSSESAMRFQFITQGQSINVAYRILMLSNPLFYSLKNTINDPTWRSVTDHIERARVPVLRRLEAWQKPMPLQWCIRDIWHDHILFDGDRVTGIIDYGTVRIDTPATDVARMLGDLVGDRRDLWELGASQFPDYPRDLILALDLAGTLGSAIHWLRQWSEHGSLPTRGMERLMRILRRLEVMKVG
jgi:homoserine kinase type II